MFRVWKWYQHCLVKHPVKTQMISSGVLWGLGDIGAQSTFSSMARKTLQSSENNEKFKIDWRRVRQTSLFAFAVIGPVGHFWYKGLDLFLKGKMVRQPNSLRFAASGMQQNSLRFVASKVALDGVIFGPINPLVLLAFLCLHSHFNLSMGSSNKKSVPQIKEVPKRRDASSGYIPALALESGIWLVLLVVNFRYVPVMYQLQYVNVFCLIDNFLPTIGQQENIKWKFLLRQGGGMIVAEDKRTKAVD